MNITWTCNCSRLRIGAIRCQFNLSTWRFGRREIYMEQLEEFVKKGEKKLVCKLKKSLYGLKQAPCQWYKKFDSFMLDHGFKRLNVDHYLYIKRD